MGHAIHELSVSELGRTMRRKELSSVEITEHFLNRIVKLDGTIQSFIEVTAERALRQASLADELFLKGVDSGPLQGIPYALKDIIEVCGVPITCNSHVHGSRISNFTADMVDRLDKQQAVLIGKLTTHEMALGGPLFDLPYPPARNPWDLERFTGGSSSGSAAAVAARLVPLTFGTDTSGSIRGPAAHCGVVGFKPTYGLISRHGVFPLSYSLDHCGPLAGTAEDCAIAMNVVAGLDEKDESSVESDIDYCESLNVEFKGLRVGVARAFIPNTEGISSVVASSIETVIDVLRSNGAIVGDADFPPFSEFDACGRTLMFAEAYAIHESAMKNRAELFGRYTFQRLAYGAFLSASDYINAQRMRGRLARSYNKTAKQFDVIICPGSLYPPPRMDDFEFHWPPQPALTATRTIVANVVGAPAVSIPISFSPDGLPIGIQIMGECFSDARILGVADQLQSALGIRGVYSKKVSISV